MSLFIKGGDLKSRAKQGKCSECSRARFARTKDRIVRGNTVLSSYHFSDLQCTFQSFLCYFSKFEGAQRLNQEFVHYRLSIFIASKASTACKGERSEPLQYYRLLYRFYDNYPHFPGKYFPGKSGKFCTIHIPDAVFTVAFYLRKKRDKRCKFGG